MENTAAIMAPLHLTVANLELLLSDSLHHVKLETYSDVIIAERG